MFDFMRSQVNAKRARSAWDKGVMKYALELIDSLEERAAYEGETPANIREVERWALNGAMDWTQYSEGGCALVYNRQIAERLCAPYELRKTQNGTKYPNPRESWIDVQTRALYQAWNIVSKAAAAAFQVTDKRIEYAYSEDAEMPQF